MTLTAGVTTTRRRSAPAGAAVERAQTERALMDAVVELARLAGYMAYHTHDSRRSQPGFPDLVLACCDPRRARVLYVELKSSRGRLSPAQQQWRDALMAAGCEWHLWRPSDWHAGAVERTLLLLRLGEMSQDTRQDTDAPARTGNQPGNPRVSGEVRKAVRSKQSGF